MPKNDASVLIDFGTVEKKGESLALKLNVKDNDADLTFIDDVHGIMFLNDVPVWN